MNICKEIVPVSQHTFLLKDFEPQAVEGTRRSSENGLVRKCFMHKDAIKEKKKPLLVFMDEGMRDREKHLEENNRAEANGNNQSKVSEANVNIICGDGINAQGKKISNVEETKIHDREVFAASSGEDTSLKMQEHGRCNAEEAKIPEVECETSSASSDEDSLPLQAIDERRSKRRKLIDGDSEAVSLHSKRVEQSDKNKQTSPIVNTPSKSRRSSSALITDKVLNEKVKPSIRLKQPQQPSVKLAIDAYGCGKCKRRFWTEREEVELREGVEKFSKEPIKNPWRKILELGQNVFDETRAPSDLKDKWRSIVQKESNYVKVCGDDIDHQSLFCVITFAICT
ncbi:hypothetical protein DH2020_035032 [Rehmannia glutinosa]|uniref:Myb-like domain-containing protein n=1 Tax=Rehmannia glutinosa TaxID=99300 RepID=A0ABR0V8I7_REHGL